jgi:hypothetical protein
VSTITGGGCTLTTDTTGKQVEAIVGGGQDKGGHGRRAMVGTSPK